MPSVIPWVADTRNKRRRLVDELTQAQRDLIREVYHWDFELYDYALKRFAEQNSGIDFGPSLERYKEACAEQYRDRLIGSSADDAMLQRFDERE